MSKPITVKEMEAFFDKFRQFMDKEENDKHDMLPTLALHGYAWISSAAMNGGVGTNKDGWKVAVDLDTGEWMHYRSKRERSFEGKGRESLAHFLRKNKYE